MFHQKPSGGRCIVDEAEKAELKRLFTNVPIQIVEKSAELERLKNKYACEKDDAKSGETEEPPVEEATPSMEKPRQENTKNDNWKANTKNAFSLMMSHSGQKKATKNDKVENKDKENVQLKGLSKSTPNKKKLKLKTPVKSKSAEKPKRERTPDNNPELPERSKSSERQTKPLSPNNKHSKQGSKQFDLLSYFGKPNSSRANSDGEDEEQPIHKAPKMDVCKMGNSSTPRRWKMKIHVSEQFMAEFLVDSDQETAGLSKQNSMNENEIISKTAPSKQLENSKPKTDTLESNKQPSENTKTKEVLSQTEEIKKNSNEKDKLEGKDDPSSSEELKETSPSGSTKQDQNSAIIPEKPPDFHSVGRKRKRRSQLLELVESSSSSEESVIEIPKEKSNSAHDELKKSGNLAPIFNMKKSKKEVSKETQDFLKSGLPGCLQNFNNAKSSMQENGHCLPPFPEVSHVRQKTDSALWHLPEPVLPVGAELPRPTCDPSTIRFNSLTCSSAVVAPLPLRHDRPGRPDGLKHLVHQIKLANPEHPVYRIFHCVYDRSTEQKTVQVPVARRTRRGRRKAPKQAVAKVEVVPLQWTDKYLPRDSGEFLANSRPAEKLRKWLEAWLLYSAAGKRKRKRNCSTSSCDFEENSSSCGAAEEAVATPAVPDTSAVLVGPCGTGKTSVVYALCRQLNIGVIEINASTRRTGRKMLQELQEATKSYQVGKMKENSLGNFLTTKKTKTESEEPEKKLTLILVEDVDIVFDDVDDGFVNALSTLVTSSKRPVVLVSSDPSNAILKRFTSEYLTIKFHRTVSVSAAVWLQVICAVEGVTFDLEHIDKLLKLLNNDIRQTLLTLQFLVLSGSLSVASPSSVGWSSSPGCVYSTTDADTDLEGKDDDSAMAWLDQCSGSTPAVPQVQWFNCYEWYSHHIKYRFPYDCDSFWWDSWIVQRDETDISNHEKSLEKLTAAAEAAECLAFVDHLSLSLAIDLDGKSLGYPWQRNTGDGMSCDEDTRNEHHFQDFNCEIAQQAMELSLRKWGPDLDKCPTSYDFYSEKIRQRAKIQDSMQDLLGSVPAFGCTDHNSTFLDYQSTLRTIARAESCRGEANTKRGNRFYHYFKGLNIHCSKAALDRTCSAFMIKSSE